MMTMKWESFEADEASVIGAAPPRADRKGESADKPAGRKPPAAADRRKAAADPAPAPDITRRVAGGGSSEERSSSPPNSCASGTGRHGDDPWMAVDHCPVPRTAVEPPVT